MPIVIQCFHGHGGVHLSAIKSNLRKSGRSRGFILAPPLWKTKLTHYLNPVEVSPTPNLG
jgi:hypothetical protein